MKYYVKQALLPFVYLFFMAITSFGILCIGDNLLWLKIVLAILNVGLYAVIVCAVAFKEGEESIKVRHANDLERREIIRTGEDRPLKLHEEYKPFKGFLIGGITCVPLVVLLILHAIISNTTGNVVFGAIAGIIYLMIFSFRMLKTGSVGTMPMNSYYLTLIAIPVLVLMFGIGYNLGARKAYLQREVIRKRQESIYGEQSNK